jgi:hypothetical protein
MAVAQIAHLTAPIAHDDTGRSALTTPTVCGRGGQHGHYGHGRRLGAPSSGAEWLTRPADPSISADTPPPSLTTLTEMNRLVSVVGLGVLSFVVRQPCRAKTMLPT